MKRSISIMGSVLLAVALSSPAWAGHGNGKGNGGGESQSGGLPALEDRVDADEALITTLQGQVATLQANVSTLLGQNNWAVVNADGSIARASSTSVVEGDAHVAGSGVYEVNFGKDVSKCAYQATIGGTATLPVPQGEIVVAGDTDGDSPNDVTVTIFNAAETLPMDSSFHLTVTCP